ncbi:NRF6-like protein [Mya arenaria]|uniref:NRF6-like protein n=1 Tax=Mya arenaria TaxID=6604 RepID=A0ABY7GJX4_MYAAR|nr:NRF6-like protein [Mya arenaria]
MKELNQAQNNRQSVERYSKELNRVRNAVKRTTDKHEAAGYSTTTDDTIKQAAFLIGESLAAPEYNVSEECTNSTNIVLQELTAGQTWAVQMIDAAGKPPSGLFDLHTTWLGDWEECLVIEPLVNDTRTNISYKPFDTQYCTAVFPVGTKGSAASVLTGGNVINLRVGVVICGLFALVMLAATAYDVMIQQVLNEPPKGYSTVASSNHENYNNHNLRMDGNTGNGYGSNGNLRNDHVIDEAMAILEGSAGRVSHSGRDMDKVEHGEHRLKKYQPGKGGRLLLSFSVYTNAQKILSTSQPAKTLTSINGIRFISMLWVVFGHTYSAGTAIIDNGATFLPVVFKRFTYQVIVNATFAVDTFFVLSSSSINTYIQSRSESKIEIIVNPIH